MSNPDSALADPAKPGEIMKYQLSWLRRGTRQCLADVVTAPIQARSTKHARLEQATKLRRGERCLHDEQFDGGAFLKLLLPLLPDEKLVMVMDSPDRKYAEAGLYLLVPDGYTLPLVWTAWPHGGGSDSALRARLVARLPGVPLLKWSVFRQTGYQALPASPGRQVGRLAARQGLGVPAARAGRGSTGDSQVGQVERLVVERTPRANCWPWRPACESMRRERCTA